MFYRKLTTSIFPGGAKKFHPTVITQLLQFVTWIDSPNGGHSSPEKVTVMCPNEVTLKNLDQDDCVRFLIAEHKD